MAQIFKIKMSGLQIVNHREWEFVLRLSANKYGLVGRNATEYMFTAFNTVYPNQLLPLPPGEICS